MLNTNQGFNAYAILVPAIGIIETMPDGIWKWTLLGIVCVAATVIGIVTKGSGINPKEAKEVLDAVKNVKQVLDEGREP